METILNYLNTMFMNLPHTPEVEKAKMELSSMMEDKYNELLAEGKKENEAIGIVISEFGNLEELSRELGIENLLLQQGKNTSQRFVSQKEVVDYININKHSIKYIAFGVLLCIFSPITLFILLGISSLNSAIFSGNIATVFGLISLAVFISCAVGIFIYHGTRLEKYNYLKTESVDISTEGIEYAKKLEQETQGQSIFKLIFGIILCVLGGLALIIITTLSSKDNPSMPLVISANHTTEDFWSYIAVSILLVLVGIGVFLIIRANSIKECVKVLIENNTDTFVQKKKADKIIGIISSIYWPLIVIAYLLSSFLSSAWNITWLIWPIAGITFGIIATICSVVITEKNI